MNHRRCTLVATTCLLGLGASQAHAAPGPYHAPVVYAGSTGQGHGQVATADFEGDGDIDFAVTESNGVTVWHNQGNGTFGRTAHYPTGSEAGAVATADFDSDGDADLAVTNLFQSRFDQAIVVLANNGDGTFAPAGRYGTGSGPVQVKAADFNGDGLADLATVGVEPFQNVMVYVNQGDGAFVRSYVTTAGVFPLSMETSDVNGDGSADLLLGDSIGRVLILTSNRNGTFSPRAAVATYTGMEGFAVGDVNRDGVADVMIPGLVRNVVSTFLGRGNGTFGPAINSRVNPGVALLPPTINVAAGLVDFNGDGANDLAVSGGADQKLYIMAGTGTGRFSTVETHPVGTPRTIVADDFNGDGLPDLAATSLNGGTSILLHS